MSNQPRQQDYVYDIETYPNFFSMGVKHALTGNRWVFEISEWKNQAVELFKFLATLRQTASVMVGYNSVGFDYPVIHLLTTRQGYVTYQELYQKAQDIITSGRRGDRFSHIIWDKDRYVDQVDLMKIHHFDNQAKMTSLKVLEINMAMNDVRDLPYDPTLPVTREQADHLLSYMDHDIDATELFYLETLPLIEFRAKLSEQYGKNMMNHSDTKIGSDIFVTKLEEAGIPTTDPVTRQKLQTFRSEIRLADVIFPYVHFERPEFNRILDFFKTQVLDPESIKGFFKSVTATVDGFDFDFGAGGIHGSLHKTVVRASETHALIDSDVASYYPNLAIQNRLYPAHLGEAFCDIYQDLYFERKQYPKSNPINGAIKLALNGTYGNSNNEFSVFYDPLYTMTVTINGQLSLCMLAEQLMKIPGLKMVQINTDGLTYLCPREYQEHAMNVSAWWEQVTKLELEHADYKLMAIRDVNSYIAVTTEGKVKRIGAYAYVKASENPATREVPWHKDHSSLIIQKAAVAALVDNVAVEQTIRECRDPQDFILKAKAPGKSWLRLNKPIWWGSDKVMDQEQQIQSTSRYYISAKGGALAKIMPPTPATVKKWAEGDHYRHRVSGKYEVRNPGQKPTSGMYDLVESPDRTAPDRVIGVQTGWGVKECNAMSDFDWADLDYSYYIDEAKKLVDPLLLGE